METTSNTQSDQAPSNYEYSSAVGDEEHVYDENDVDGAYVEADIGEYDDDEKTQDVVDIDGDDDYVVWSQRRYPRDVKLKLFNCVIWNDF